MCVVYFFPVKFCQLKTQLPFTDVTDRQGVTGHRGAPQLTQTDCWVDH